MNKRKGCGKTIRLQQTPKEKKRVAETFPE